MVETVSLPRLSLAERDRRWARVRAAMAKAGIDCIVTAPNTGDWDAFQPDARYLTTVGGGGTAVVAVFPAAGAPIAIVREPRRAEFWRRVQGWVEDIRGTTEGRWGAAIAAAIADKDCARGRIGIAGLEGVLREPEGTLGHGAYLRIAEDLPGASLVDATALMHALRLVKSAEEIAVLERAQSCADAVSAALFATARAGVPEHEVYAAMVAAHIRAGGEMPGMFLFAAGPAPNQTFLLPTERRLAPGDVILGECEVKYAGYMAQSVETVAIGAPHPEYDRLFAASRGCFEVILAAMKPGVPYAELIRLWHRHMDEAGCRAAPTMGHGLGLGQDGPSTRSNGDAQGLVVADGHCFILKPWATSPDGQRACRAGNTVVVGPTSARRLGRLALELRRLG